MNIRVVIEPHERREAIEAYRQWLSPEQDKEIEDAPDGALVFIERVNGSTTIRIVEEG